MILKNKLFKGIIITLTMTITLTACSTNHSDSEDITDDVNNKADTEVISWVIEEDNNDYSDTASLEFLIQESQEILENIEGEHKVNTISADSDILKPIKLVEDNKGIARYQLIDILYQMLYESRQLPDLNGYQVDYEDMSEVPSKYITQISYLTYLEVIDFGTKIDGYKYVTEEEVTTAITKLKEYLENYESWQKVIEEASENEEKPSVSEINTSVQLDKAEFIDTLNGQSVALFSEPKTLEQLKANINNLTVTDIFSTNIQNRISQGQKINYEYITPQQGLLNTDLIDKAIEDVIGLTKGNTIELGVIVSGPDGDGNYYLSLDYTNLNKDDQFSNILYGVEMTVGIKDNKVVEIGQASPETHKKEIYFDYCEIDTIGIIVDKGKLENSENTGKYIIYLLQLGDNTINNIRNGVEQK